MSDPVYGVTSCVAKMLAQYEILRRSDEATSLLRVDTLDVTQYQPLG